MARAALFDLDRTLVRRETASLYVRYQREIGEATVWDAARMFYWVTQYTLGTINLEEVAARAVRTFAGMHETVFSARCDDWFRRYVEQHLCDLGRRAVERHREGGDFLAIVTGASNYIARPAARRLGIDHVVGTELEIGRDGAFTGRFVAPICYGAGKVERASQLAERLGFRLEEATFYTDSFTDLPLLERVGERVIVNPDPRLKRHARKKGWRVERW
jgi:HAD superfamily hydrolase (TIGR01490 family)